MKRRTDFGMQILLTLLGAFVVGFAVRFDPHYNPRWITAGASVALLVSTIYISHYLWLVSVHLQQLCRMLAGEEFVDPELSGSLNRLVGIVKELGESDD